MYNIKIRREQLNILESFILIFQHYSKALKMCIVVNNYNNASSLL